MSLSHVNRSLRTHQLVIDLKRDRSLRDAFKEGEASVLDRYDLSPEERQSIERRDFGRLYDLGVHQYLVAQLSRLIYGTADGSSGGESMQVLMQQMRGRDRPGSAP
jgi:protocatechuate 4,5-dioxygenase alpha chain